MNKNIVSAILLIHLVECNYEAMSFSKQLYIPGGYYSLNNISYNMNALGRLFNVDVDMSLTQTSASDQANSIFDIFVFNLSDYEQVQPCYQSAIDYLHEMYSLFQPCEGGCQFYSQYEYNQSHSLLDSEYFQLNNNISVIVDNTYYPCRKGVYQSEIYLYEVNNLTIQSNEGLIITLKIVCILFLQVIIFLFAYLIIKAKELQKKRKKLKQIRLQNQDLEMLDEYKRQNLK